MTDQEWRKEQTRLKSAITRAKTRLSKAGSLQDKLVVKSAVKSAEEALHQHRLNYFELVTK